MINYPNGPATKRDHKILVSVLVIKTNGWYVVCGSKRPVECRIESPGTGSRDGSCESGHRN